MSYRWGNQYKIWSDYLCLTGCTAAVLATTVESSPAIFSMGMYQGVLGCRSSLPRQNGESKLYLQCMVARLILQFVPFEWQLSIVAYEHCLSETDRIDRVHLLSGN